MLPHTCERTPSITLINKTRASRPLARAQPTHHTAQSQW